MFKLCAKSICSITLLALAFGAARLHAEDNTPLPFTVKIGGQEAKAADKKEYGEVANAVASDAELEVGVKDKTMVIVNIWPLTAEGKPKADGAAAILMIQNANKTTLNKTLDGKALPAGNYRMNIVGDNNTAMVNFKVK